MSADKLDALLIKADLTPTGLNNDNQSDDGSPSGSADDTVPPADDDATPPSDDTVIPPPSDEEVTPPADDSGDEVGPRTRIC
ncbi:MAG: hypothetical protein WDN09_02650 [bacterium]